jgi:hypothetical protein
MGEGGFVRRGVFLAGILAVLLIGLNMCGSAHAGPLQPNATFNGGVAFSADAVPGFLGGNLRVDTTAANLLASPNTQDVTVKAAYLYNVTVVGSSPLTTLASLNGNMVTLDLLKGTDPAGLNLQTYRANVTSIVSPLINGKPGITALPASLISTDPESDGLALVVVFASPGLDPRQSVAIIDGGQAGPTPQTTTFGLKTPLDKSPGFNAVLSLGINFGQQGGGGPHFCGTTSLTQFSFVDVNGIRLTSCAGGSDDGPLITVGGVGDSTDLPSNPTCQAGPPPPGRPNCSTTDDELYDISSFLKQGDPQVSLTTSNISGITPLLGDDSIFLGILQLTGCINQINGISQGDCEVVPPPPPPPGVPGPAPLTLLVAGLLGLIAARRVFGKR